MTNSPDYKKLTGRYIKAVRTQLGLKQWQFANVYNALEPRELKTNRAELSHYENGDVNVPAPKLLKFLSMTPVTKGVLNILEGFCKSLNL